MAMAVGSGKGGTMMSLNVTPLIDVLLVLIIIFMVINHHTPAGLAAIAPQPNKKKQQQVLLDRTIVVTIDASRQVAINTQPVTVDQLGARLVDIFKTRNNRIIFVKGAPSLPFEDVAEIVDIAKGAQIDKVGLITHAMEEGK